jgi:hypothetical protein
MDFPARGALDGKDFIKLKDGESLVMVLQGTPFDFKQHWENQKPILCTQDDKCKYCDRNLKAKFGFRVNAIITENGTATAKILSGGWKLYESLMDLNQEFPLEKNAIKVSRKGSGMNDTRYSVVPSPVALTEEQLAKIKAVKLLDLTNFESPKETKEMRTGIDSDLPF